MDLVFYVRIPLKIWKFFLIQDFIFINMCGIGLYLRPLKLLGLIGSITVSFSTVDSLLTLYATVF